MNHEIKFWRFADGSYYTIAREIENYAASFGASIRRDSKGVRHSGSVVNENIRAIKKDAALSRHFNLKQSDCIQLDISHPGNFTVIDDMINEEIINHSSLKEGFLDMYSRSVCQACVARMIRDGEFHMESEDIEVLFDYDKINILTSNKRFDKKRDRVDESRSLIARKAVKQMSQDSENCMRSYLETHFNEKEQEVIREYFRGIRTSRENGRPYIKKGGAK